MTIEVNGASLELDEPATVAAVVERTGAAERRGVAVAVDGEVVPRSAWAQTEVRDGQRIEVVGAIQGG